MSLCDICNIPVEGTKIRAEDMRKAADRGFNPFRAQPMEPARLEQWRLLVREDGTQWNVCGDCLQAAKPYLDRESRAGDVGAGVLAGHEQRLMDVALSPAGDRVLTCGWDETVRLWDFASGRQLACLREHRGFVSAVAFAPGGRMAASGGSDRVIRLWDLDRQAVTHRLSGHSFTVFDLQFSSQGSMLLSGSGDCTVRLWDARTGKGIRKLGGLFGPKHASGVQSVRFSPDQSQALSVGLDAMLWEVKSGTRICVFEGRPFWHGAFLRDGKRVILSGPHGFSIFNAQTGTQIEQLNGIAAGHGKFAVTPDDRLLFGHRSAVMLYDLEQRRVLFHAENHRQDVTSAAITPDGRRCATASDDRTARAWTLA